MKKLLKLTVFCLLAAFILVTTPIKKVDASSGGGECEFPAFTWKTKDNLYHTTFPVPSNTANGVCVILGCSIE